MERERSERGGWIEVRGFMHGVLFVQSSNTLYRTRIRGRKILNLRKLCMITKIEDYLNKKKIKKRRFAE